MANKKNITREALLDETERLWIMGARKPYQLMKLLNITNWQTADEYLRIAVRRVMRRHRHIDKARHFRNQLTILDHVIFELWGCYREAKRQNNDNGCIGALNTILKVMKSQAELLGLVAPQQMQPSPPPQQERTVDMYEQIKGLPDEEREQFLETLEKVLPVEK